MKLDTCAICMQNMRPSGCDLVRTSAEIISRAASHVRIRHGALKDVTARMDEDTLNLVIGGTGWDRSMHFADTTRPELLLRYLLVLDSLNFCFWPLSHLEYDNLARGLKVQFIPCGVLIKSMSSANRSLLPLAGMGAGGPHRALMRGAESSYPRNCPAHDAARQHASATGI